MPAAVGELGLAADPAGRGIVLVDGLLPFVLYSDPPYLLLIALELLMKRPGCERQKKQKTFYNFFQVRSTIQELNTNKRLMVIPLIAVWPHKAAGITVCLNPTLYISVIESNGVYFRP